MQTVLRFALEQTILNSFAILLGIGVAALVLGGFLGKRRVGPLGRSFVYAGVGVVGGIWSYVTFDKEPATQYLTVPVLIISFLVASLIVIAPITYYRSKKQLARYGAGDGA